MRHRNTILLNDESGILVIELFIMTMTHLSDDNSLDLLGPLESDFLKYIAMSHLSQLPCRLR